MASMKGCRLFDTSASGAIAAGNTNLVSLPLDMAESDAASFQILTDGNASVNWTIQGTLCPGYFTNNGKPALFGSILQRDDTFASNMWSTLPNGTGTLANAGGTTQGTLIIIPPVQSVYRRLRVTLAYGGAGTSAKCMVIADSAVTGP